MFDFVCDSYFDIVIYYYFIFFSFRVRLDVRVSSREEPDQPVPSRVSEIYLKREILVLYWNFEIFYELWKILFKLKRIF